MLLLLWINIFPGFTRCGARSGYCEIINLDNSVKEMLMELLASRLCPTLYGQVSFEEHFIWFGYVIIKRCVTLEVFDKLQGTITNMTQMKNTFHLKEI